MPVIEKKVTKDQIVEKLDKLSPELLRGVLNYVEFVSMDPVARSLLTCGVDEEPLSDKARELIQDAANEPRPGIPDKRIRQELGL